MQDVIKRSCEPFRALLQALPEVERRNAREIRIRAGQPVRVLGLSDTALGAQGRPFCPSEAQVAELLRAFCGQSPYAFEEQMANGYLTLPGGHRVGLCVTACALLLALKNQGRSDMAFLVAIAFTALMLLWIVSTLQPLVEQLRALFQGAGLAQETVALAFKVTGIALISEFAAQICKDAGEGALAEKAALAGKIAVLALALPLLVGLCQAALELLA